MFSTKGVVAIGLIFRPDKLFSKCFIFFQKILRVMSELPAPCFVSLLWAFQFSNFLHRIFYVHAALPLYPARLFVPMEHKPLRPTLIIYGIISYSERLLIARDNFRKVQAAPYPNTVNCTKKSFIRQFINFVHLLSFFDCPPLREISAILKQLQLLPASTIEWH